MDKCTPNRLAGTGFLGWNLKNYQKIFMRAFNSTYCNFSALFPLPVRTCRGHNLRRLLFAQHSRISFSSTARCSTLVGSAIDRAHNITYQPYSSFLFRVPLGPANLSIPPGYALDMNKSLSDMPTRVRKSRVREIVVIQIILKLWPRGFSVIRIQLSEDFRSNPLYRMN